MSPSSYRSVKLSQNEANKQLAKIAGAGLTLVVSSHAKSQMKERDLTLIDITNVLLCKTKLVRSGEAHGQGFTYRVETKKIAVVIAFNELGTKIIIVTAWRKERL